MHAYMYSQFAVAPDMAVDVLADGQAHVGCRHGVGSESRAVEKRCRRRPGVGAPGGGGRLLQGRMRLVILPHGDGR